MMKVEKMRIWKERMAKMESQAKDADCVIFMCAFLKKKPWGMESVEDVGSVGDLPLRELCDASATLMESWADECQRRILDEYREEKKRKGKNENS